MATDTSSKYDNITSKVLIQSGSPAVYQLTPKKEKMGTLTRITLGERNVNKTNKTILLVGEIGTGKSALIDTLVNYTMGVKWEDEVWFQIVKDEKRSQSETSDVMVYQIFGFEDKTLPYSLTIINTPGYGDTRGIEQDVIVSQRLFDLFRSEDGVHEINAVGLVLKATENRLSDRLRYIFDSVVSLFGKDMEKNLVVLITHSDGRTPEDALKALEAANIKCARDEKNQPVHFLFDNCQKDDRTEDTEYLKHADKITMKGMSQLTDFLEKTAPQKLETTVKVLKERIRLTVCIKNLKDQVESIELKQKEIQQTQEALKTHEEEMKRNENFTEEVDEAYKDREPIDGETRWWALCSNFKGATCCTTCEENCHYPGCTMTQSPRRCKVMKDGRCTSCTRKCLVSDHVKENWIYVTKTRRVQKTVQEMKEKYEKAKANCEETTKCLENLGKEIEELQKEKVQLLEESFQHVVKLEQIALNVDSLSTHVHLDFLIEKMKEKRDTEKVQELEEMKSRQDEGVLAGLRFKLTSADKESLTNMNTPSKYDNITSKVLIQSGSPTRYQLTPKKEKIGTLTRMTLGERNVNKTNKTILLVGETGTGKSTLINALVNYTMGVKWEDDVWFQIVEDEKRSQSETSDVMVYQIFGFEDKTLPYSLTIIDTPGYGDTRGTEQDVIASQRLFDLFRSEDGVHEINAVGLVLKATENRLSDRLRYIFKSAVSLFGKDMKNIVALITHSDGRTPKDALKALEAANIQCARNEKNQPVHFLFNNRQDEDRTEDTEYLKYADEITAKGMSHFINFLKKTAPQKLAITTDIRNEQDRLAACIQNLQKKIESIEHEQREQKQKEIQNNEKFTGKVAEVYKEKIRISGGRWEAACCKVCEETCHYPCIASSGPGHCEVMKDGRCTSCTGKCPASDHVKEKWIYVTQTRRVQKIKQDLQKDQLLEESFQHVVNLEQIALNVDSLSTHVHLDFLIEKMKEKGDTEKVQKLEKMKSRQEERTRKRLQFLFDKLKAAVKTKA